MRKSTNTSDLWSRARRIIACALVAVPLGVPMSGVKAAPASLDGDPARFTMVACKMPDQQRKAGRYAITTIPGKVQRLAVAACEDLGGLYVLGLCAERASIQKNAESGDIDAIRLMGQLLESKSDPDCPPKIQESLNWYQRAAAKGDRQSAMALSRLLAGGDSAIRADPVKAHEWLKLALGENSSIVISQESKQLLEKMNSMQQRQTDLELQIQRLEQEREDRRKRGAAISPEIEKQLSEVRSSVAALDDDYEKSAAALDPRLLISQPEVGVGGIQIVMLDPPIMETRSGQPVVFPVSGTAESRLDYEVSGRVIAPAHLLRSLLVKVNGRPVSRIEDDGFFRERIPMLGRVRNVTIEAAAQGVAPAIQRFRLELTKTGDQRMAIDPSPRPRGARSIALVVGISNYNQQKGQASGGKNYWANLANARWDAEELGKVLARDYGFTVEYLLDADATHDRILNALIRMRETVNENDQVLIYYAGHGEIDRNSTRGFWIPYDAWHEATIGPKWIQSEQITNALEAIKARQILLISDSCYSAALNTAVGGISPLATTRTRAQAIAELDRRSARLVMTSGSFSPVPDGGGGRHSLFTGALIDSLKVNNGTVFGKDLFRRVEGLVLRRARELNQTINPQYGGLDAVGHLGGDFALRRTS